ncbi:MAG TPA: hypothetical protein VGB59_02820 [Allosphingosinicella sp.]
MGRYIVILLSLLFAAPAAAEWREASSRHFIVYSEGSEESVRAFATKLERFHQAMNRVQGAQDEDLGAASRLTVYVVPDLNGVRRLARAPASSPIAGFYVARAGGSIAVTPRRSGEGDETDLKAETILLHEYTHHMMRQRMSGAIPVWYNEGFAEFGSTARFEKNGDVGIGMPPVHRAYGLFSDSALSVQHLFDAANRKLTQEEQEATIYGRGWLLTHYLAFEKSRNGQLSAYLKAINSGQDSLEAAKAAFGDLKKLDRELRDYLMKRRISYVLVEAAGIEPGPVTVRTLRPGEAAIMPMRMRSNLGVTSTEAKGVAKEMRAAAAPYANDPAVQAALAEAEFDAQDLDAAEAAADRSIAADPQNIDALLYKARVLIARAEKEENSASLFKEARRLIAKANRTDPDNPKPLILFYSSFANEGVAATANAVKGLVHAQAVAPHDMNLRMMVARQHLIDGKAAEARAMLKAPAYDPHGGGLKKAASAILAKLDEAGPKAALDTWDSLGSKEAEEEEEEETAKKKSGTR